MSDQERSLRAHLESTRSEGVNKCIQTTLTAQSRGKLFTGYLMINPANEHTIAGHYRPCKLPVNEN